jgi:ankyrin repeat protein
MRNPKLLCAITLLCVPVLAGAAENLAGMVRNNDRQGAMAALRAGADVNELQPDGSSALLWAVHKLDHELVAELLKRGANPNQRNMLGATPLCEAISLADEKGALMLLKAGADANLGNDDDESPLMLAARAGSLPIAQALVKAGAKVNQREKFRNQSALMWAVAANAPEVVALLIKNKAEVEIRSDANDWGSQITSEPRAQYRDTGGLTPLLFATRFGCLECVKSLLKAGADINRPTPEGVTPLMNAIDNNQYAIANYLLDQGANPHLFDWWSRTALYLTADMRTRGGMVSMGNTPRARVGEETGGRSFQSGDRSSPAIDAATPNASAVNTGPIPTGTAQPRATAIQVMQRLLEMGVDPNPQLDMHRPFRGRFADDLFTTGCTPLLRAAVSVDKDVVALLLKHGALPDLPNVMGITPLMAAAGIGASRGRVRFEGPLAGVDPQEYSIAVSQMLIKAGADVNARITDTSSRTAVIARPNSVTDRQGQTALFGAVSQNWVRVAKFLLDQGAKADIQDARGKTLADALKGDAGGRDTFADLPTPIGDDMVKLIKGAMGT